MPDMVRGGHWLRELRNAHGWPLNASFIKRAESLFGDENQIDQGKVSRIENGLTVRPSMELLCQLGTMYGRFPNEIARVYDFPVPGGHVQRDPRVERIEEIASSLPEGARERFYIMVDTAASMALEAARMEMHSEVPPTPITPRRELSPA